MARIAPESGTPDWWQRAIPGIERAISDRPTRPSALWRVDTTADLPPAADWPAALAFHNALGVPVVSDGVSWFPITVGAAL